MAIRNILKAGQRGREVSQVIAPPVDNSGLILADALSGALNKTAGILADKHAKQQTEAGALAATEFDEQGLPTAVSEGNAFDRGVATTLNASLRTNANKKIAELHDEFGNNPEELKIALESYEKSIYDRVAKNMPSFAGQVQASMRDMSSTMLAKARSEKKKRDVARVVDELESVIQTTNSNVERLVSESINDKVMRAGISAERSALENMLLGHVGKDAADISKFKSLNPDIAKQLGIDTEDGSRTGLLTLEKANEIMHNYDVSAISATATKGLDDAFDNGNGDEYVVRFMRNKIGVLTDDEQDKITRKISVRLSRYKRLQAQEQKGAMNAQATAKALDAQKIRLGVSRNEITSEELDESLANDIITPSQWATHNITLDRLNRQEAEGVGYKGLVMKALRENIQLNAGDKGVEEAVSQSYQDNLGGLDPYSSEGMQVGISFAEVGVIPPQVGWSITQEIGAGEPDRAVRAVDYMARLKEKAPHAYYSTFSKEERQLAEVVSRRVAAGGDPFQVLEDARAWRDTSPAEKKVWAEQHIVSDKDFNAKADESLASLVDDKWDPFWGATPKVSNLMKAEYREAYRGHLQATKDDDIARKLANEDMARVWGVDDLMGERRMMKASPTTIFPQGSEDWLKESLGTRLSELGSDDIEVYSFVSDAETLRGNNISYQIMIVDEYGHKVPARDENHQLARWHPKREDTALYKEAEAERQRIYNDALEAGKPKPIDFEMNLSKTPRGLE